MSASGQQVQSEDPVSAVCAWSEAGESWRLRLVLPDSLIPAAAGPGADEDVFADVNGITDRRDVRGGVMPRVTGESQEQRLLDLTVPRGFRGSLQFLPVARGLGVADRSTWLAALERAFLPLGAYGLREVTDIRGRRILELSAPDARPLVWTGEGAPEVGASASSGPTVGTSACDEQVVTLDSTPRRIWIHRPERAPASAPVLVVFDGEWFVRGGLLAGIDELMRPPSVVIAIDHAPCAEATVSTDASTSADDYAAADLRASDLVMNPRFCDDVLDLVRRIAPDAPERALVVGASYGGLAATYFALRHPRSFRGISLSPSYWQSDEQGRRIWDFVPEVGGLAETVDQSASHEGVGQGAGDGAGQGVRRGGTREQAEFCVDHGTLETTIADSVAEAVGEFAARGIDIAPTPFVGGHEVLWWRELILVRLAQILA
ncbi:alpha/beta hydrolase [Brevibacterium oceani]|uniref:alpha/beta hydrolase n=1 Tax=Brevibacterium oceani TaxID=358099 RepID=UPI0015E79AAD|nr:alpha/beta hydrolase-fold protein [Brevibacterium oceani]